MNITVFTTHPTAAYQLRSETDKPTITIIVGCTSLGTYLSLEIITIAQTPSSTIIYYTHQHRKHLHCIGCTNHLIHSRLECSNGISFIVLYSTHKHRSCTDTMIGKYRIGTHHLAHTHFTRTETETHGCMNIRIMNTEVMENLNKLVWIQLAHQISTDPVVTLRQSPLQWYHLSITGMTHVTRSPRPSANYICPLSVRSIITRCESVLHS